MRFKAKQAAAQAAAMSAGGHPSNWGSQPTAMRSPSSPSGSYFQEDYGQGTPRSRFSQSPDYNDGDYGGFHPNRVFPPGQPPRGPPTHYGDGSGSYDTSPAMRRGPFPSEAYRAHSAFGGMPGEGIVQDMISGGAGGLFSQDDVEADGAEGTQNGEGEVDEEAVEEDDGEELPVQVPAKVKGKRKRKVAKTLPAEPRVKWTAKEDECLAESWKIVSIDPCTGANQNSETYWARVLSAFDERKLCDPEFNTIHMDRGEKAITNHWATVQKDCNKWHGIQEEVERRQVSGENFEQKVNFCRRTLAYVLLIHFAEHLHFGCCSSSGCSRRSAMTLATSSSTSTSSQGSRSARSGCVLASR